ncbi:MarR family winged helix-turn-helix transcriptional regulator [Sphaerimonospora mesophila]|uniref:MarR family winged helix-turn-helix transcriptional regulator n=1 Tax=Sphaerimonospora mesophila TaxID=37483 RepID=UPI000B33FAE8
MSDNVTTAWQQADDDHGGSDRREQSERRALIGRLFELQRELTRLFTHDRSNPLLVSTLTMQQLKVVIVLVREGATPGQTLARALGTGLGTVTGIVDRLVAQGLVSRREDPADRRVRLVELTPRGRVLAEELLDASTAGYLRLLDRLDTETLQSMERVMLKIQTAAAEMYAEETRLAP